MAERTELRDWPTDALTLQVGDAFLLYGPDDATGSLWRVTRLEDREGWTPRVHVEPEVAIA